MSYAAHLAAHCTALGTASQPVQMSRWSAGLAVQGAASDYLQAAPASLATVLQMYLQAGREFYPVMCLAHLLLQSCQTSIFAFSASERLGPCVKLPAEALLPHNCRPTMSQAAAVCCRFAPQLSANHESSRCCLLQVLRQPSGRGRSVASLLCWVAAGVIFRPPPWRTVSIVSRAPTPP